MRIFRFMFICTAVLVMASCNENEKVMGPEEVAVAFGKAVATGDFCAARALCDTVSMNDYIENCRKAMNAAQKEDSCAFKIALSMMAGADFEVTGIEKNGDERIVGFKIAAGGNEKIKKATMKKEEGEWRVRAIADEI